MIRKRDKDEGGNKLKTVKSVEMSWNWKNNGTVGLQTAQNSGFLRNCGVERKRPRIWQQFSLREVSHLQTGDSLSPTIATTSAFCFSARTEQTDARRCIIGSTNGKTIATSASASSACEERNSEREWMFWERRNNSGLLALISPIKVSGVINLPAFVNTSAKTGHIPFSNWLITDLRKSEKRYLKTKRLWREREKNELKSENKRYGDCNVNNIVIINRRNISTCWQLLQPRKEFHYEFLKRVNEIEREWKKKTNLWIRWREFGKTTEKSEQTVFCTQWHFLLLVKFRT